MNEEKQIDEMAETICRRELDPNCSDCYFNGNCRDYLVAKKLYNKGYRKQEWISVEERLPTWEDGKVLVFTKYGFSICERTVNSRWQGKHANWITHWMPLPEPPKGE